MKNHWAYSDKREEVGKLISSKTKGRHLSPKSEFKKGHKMSEETKRKISQTMKGRKPNNFGIPHTLEQRKKISKALQGEKSPNWKGGIYARNKLFRLSLEYRDWIKSVYKRDNYTCQICEKRGVELNANHIKKFADYPELRIELSNGITLCKDCHFSLVNGHETEWESYFNFNLETRFYEA